MNFLGMGTVSICSTVETSSMKAVMNFSNIILSKLAILSRCRQLGKFSVRADPLKNLYLCKFGPGHALDTSLIRACFFLVPQGIR